MYQINECVDIIVSREEANFDRACDTAYRHALSQFQVDQDGHIKAVKDSERCRDSIEVQFVSYVLSGGMSGVSHTYMFQAWVSRCEED
jgi:hypothetical protein